MPGTRVAAHDIDMGDRSPGATFDTKRGRIFLWRVPARS